MPVNVRVEQWVDQDHVLPLADVVLCFGGSGTVLGALAHGVPLVLLPVFADQFANAGAVVATGAGLSTVVDRRNGENGPALPSTDELVSSVGNVLDDATFRERAQAVKREMSSAATVSAALDSLTKR